MKQKLLLIGFLLLMLLISGCTSGDVTDYAAPWVGGNEGLVTELVSGNPPEEIFDNGEYPFSISLKLENKGEYDIEEGDGFIKVQGINAAEFGVSDSDLKIPMPEVRGARKNADSSIIKGGTEIVSFDNLVYSKDEPGNFRINSLRVLSCYDYETKALAEVCIKEDNVDGLKDNEICLVNEPKSAVNSGGPLQVSNLLETSKGSAGVQVSFDVIHVGSPENKWFPVGDDECSDLVTNSNLYEVEVEVDPIIQGRYPAKCTGGDFNNGNKGSIKLYNGEPKKVICSFDVGDQQSDFETRVNIKLSYRYSQYVEQSLLVKDLGTE